MRFAAGPTFTINNGQRRGVALLLALVCLSVVSLAGVSLLRVASDASIMARQTRLRVGADGLSRDGERVALAWLERGGFAQIDGSVDLASFVRIAQVEDANLSITIDAIDLSGRLHISHLDSRAARGPPPGIAALREAGVASLFGPSVTARSRATSRTGQPPTPTLRGALDLSQTGALREFPRSKLASGDSDAAVLWITTRGAEPFALNVDSAPIPLLEAALTGRDPGAAARALAARREGLRVPPEVVATLSGSGTANATPLTSASNAAGFIVTIRRVGEGHPEAESESGGQRFWLVAERLGVRRAGAGGAGGGGASGGGAGGGSGGWIIVERRRAEG